MYERLIFVIGLLSLHVLFNNVAQNMVYKTGSSFVYSKKVNCSFFVSKYSRFVKSVWGYLRINLRTEIKALTALMGRFSLRVGG